MFFCKNNSSCNTLAPVEINRFPRRLRSAIGKAQRFTDLAPAKAFTMAEAIIVMTILGIIATIMITNLKPSEFRDKALLTQAKKVLREIDEATYQIMINNTQNGKLDRRCLSGERQPLQVSGHLHGSDHGGCHRRGLQGW